MNNLKNNLTSGFTLVEISIVIVILAILVSVVVSSFGNVGGSEALETSTVTIISILNDAKSQAVSSKEEASYGVRIFNNKLVSFETSYGTENQETFISNLVTISTSTGFNNSDVIFSNVSGESSASGTITISVLNDPSKISRIKVYSTGLVERN